MTEDSESDMRWVMTNETRSYQIVLEGSYLENARVKLKKMRSRNVALQEGREVCEALGLWIGREGVKKPNNGTITNRGAKFEIAENKQTLGL